MTRLLDDRIAVYDDSWQTKVEWEIRDIGLGIRTKVPITYKRALRHELFIVSDGPDHAVDRVKHCLTQSAAVGLVAAIASAYLGVGIGATEAASAAFMASVTACLGDLAREVSVILDDRSHWTDWSKI
jgi:hypothetical protein